MAGLISAAVTLRSADGSRLGDAGPITSATVREHAPSPDAVAAAEGWFRAQGFEVDSTFANSFSITAPREAFEVVFGTSGSHEDLIFPLERLPDEIRDLIDTVSFTHVDFDPPDL